MTSSYKIILFLILSTAFAEAQGQASFIKTYDLPLNATITSIAATDDNGSIVAGHTDSLGLLYRFDAIGDLVWVKQYGGSDTSISGASLINYQLKLNDVVAVPDGFVVVGSSVSSIPGEGGFQLFQMKVDLNGAVVWIGHSGSAIWSESYNTLAATEAPYMFAGGYTNSLSGIRAILTKFDHGTGESVAGTSAYYFQGIVIGDYSDVQVYGNGEITAVGDFIVRYNEALEPAWGILPNSLSFVRGLAVADNGSGMVLGTDRLIGFTSSGDLQFIKQIPGSWGEASSIIIDPNGNYRITGAYESGIIWLSTINAAGDVLWTIDLSVTGSQNEVHDMIMLPNGHTAIASTTVDPSRLQLIVTAGDTLASCAQVQPSPTYDPLIPPTIDTILFGPTATSSSIPEAMEYWSSDLYPQYFTICSSDLNTHIGAEYLDENDAGQFRFRLRPNPFSDSTVIEFDIALGNDAVIELLDIQGRIVRSANGNGSKQFYLERGDLEAGIYLVRVMQGDRLFVGRVVAE